MSGARLFAILAAFTAVTAAAGTVLLSFVAIPSGDPGASSASTLDRIMGVDKVNRPRTSRAQRARRRHRPRIYRVVENDTPTGIAKKAGLPVSELRALNRGVDVHLLQKGQKLRLR